MPRHRNGIIDQIHAIVRHLAPLPNGAVPSSYVEPLDSLVSVICPAEPGSSAERRPSSVEA